MGSKQVQSMLEVDSRRRISLGPLAEHDRYLVDVEEDGTIVLTPAVVMSAAQARLLAAPVGGSEQPKPAPAPKPARPAAPRPAPAPADGERHIGTVTLDGQVHDCEHGRRNGHMDVAKAEACAKRLLRNYEGGTAGTRVHPVRRDRSGRRLS